MKSFSPVARSFAGVRRVHRALLGLAFLPDRSSGPDIRRERDPVCSGRGPLHGTSARLHGAFPDMASPSRDRRTALHQSAGSIGVPLMGFILSRASPDGTTPGTFPSFPVCPPRLPTRSPFPALAPVADRSLPSRLLPPKWREADPAPTHAGLFAIPGQDRVLRRPENTRSVSSPGTPVSRETGSRVMPS